MNTLETIRYLSNLSPIIPLILILGLGKERFKTKTIYFLCLLLLVSGLSDITTYFMGSKQLDNALVSNFYTLLEFILLSLLYKILLPNQKMLVYGLMGLFIAFFLTNSLLLEPLSKFQSYTLTLEGVILVIFSTLYFIQHIKITNTPIPINNEISEKNLLASRKLYESIFNSKNESKLWINSAVFFYFVMDIYLFSISSYVFANESAAIAMTFWSFHNVCNIIKNVLFAVGIYYLGIKRVRPAN